MKVMYSVIFTIFTHFGAPTDSFWGLKGANTAHLLLSQPVCMNNIYLKTEIVQM